MARKVYIAATGIKPNIDYLEGSGIDLDWGVRVDDHLRTNVTNVYAAGDVAEHHADDGSALPMSAQIAVQAGEAAGANAGRVVRGDEPKPTSLTHQGWVLDLSGHRGLAEIGGHSLAGPFADLIPPFLHEAIDLKTLLDLGGLSAFFR